MSAAALDELRNRVIAQCNAMLAAGKVHRTIHLSDADAALIFAPAPGQTTPNTPEGGSTLVWGMRAFFGAPETYVA